MIEINSTIVERKRVKVKVIGGKLVGMNDEVDVLVLALIKPFNVSPLE